MNQEISKQRPLSPQSVTTRSIPSNSNNNNNNNNMEDIANNANTKHVRFTPEVEVNTFDRLDPALKADLYYSKRELYFIQKRFQLAVALRRQLIKSKELQRQFKESKAYIEYLKQKSETIDRKRHHSEDMKSIREPVEGTKRRRIQ